MISGKQSNYKYLFLNLKKLIPKNKRNALEKYFIVGDCKKNSTKPKLKPITKPEPQPESAPIPTAATTTMSAATTTSAETTKAPEKPKEPEKPEKEDKPETTIEKPTDEKGE